MIIYKEGRMVSTVGFCRRCDSEFRRETKNSKICPDCKKKSKRIGNIKRIKTIMEKWANKTLDAKLLKLKTQQARGYKRLWKITDEFGNILKKNIHSKLVADGMMRGMKLNPREDLRVVPY